AGFGAWYELFPRSTGETGDRAGGATGGAPAHGTFDTAIAALGRIAEMGFDVVCLPPVHPVGTVHRKGRDNSTWCRGDDVGSTWTVIRPACARRSGVSSMRGCRTACGSSARTRHTGSRPRCGGG